VFYKKNTCVFENDHLRSFFPALKEITNRSCFSQKKRCSMITAAGNRARW
jgi:hypothetical protein